MTFPLQKSPDGLLEALDLKSSGRTPGGVDESVQIGYDGTGHYRNNLMRVTFASAIITAGNLAGPTITVPVGSLWRIRSVQLFMIDVGAATSKAMWVHLLAPLVVGWTAGTPAQTLMFVDPVIRAAISRAAGQWQPTSDFFVPPGSVFGCTLNSLLANDVSVSLGCFYDELGTIAT